ncbi:MAG: endo-1,4-beta-xylanase [Oscillospiraceae bacterium]|nr:endo-1,4-beta-xylanase [Oscillospiraceae bacterium]
MMKRIIMFALILAFSLILVPVSAPYNAAATDTTELFIDFEDGTFGGLEPGGIGDGLLEMTITDEEARSGNYSLFISEMQEPWFAPKLQVAEYIIPDTWYEATYWVKLKTPEPTMLSLQAELIPLNSPDGWHVTPAFSSHASAARSSSEGWIEIKEVFYFDSTLYDLSSVRIYIQTWNASDEFYIDSISFRVADINQNLKNAARIPSLHEAYKDYFMIGNLTDTYPFNPHNGTIDFYRRHFNILKVMGSLAWTSGFLPQPWDFDFTAADNELEILDPDDFALIFPSIIYRMHNSEWMTRNPDGSLLTRTEAIANMERYINTTMEHYSDRFPIWEVVGEPRSNLHNASGFWIEGDGHMASWYLAFDNGADKSLGESGADYVEYAFRFARSANPAGKLYLSDQAEQYAKVADNVADLVKGINDRWLAEGNTRLLIEGIVMQGHYFLDTPLEDIGRTLGLFASLGVDIAIGELDIPLFRVHGGDFYTGSREPTQELLEKQADMYANLFLMFKEYSDAIEHVTFWGVADVTSWYNVIGPNGNVDRPMYPEFPLLFDDDFNPKLAYFAIIDPEGWLAGNFDTEEKRAAWLAANMLPEYVPEDELGETSPEHQTPQATPTPDEISQTPERPTEPHEPDANNNPALWIILTTTGAAAIVIIFLLIKRKR